MGSLTIPDIKMDSVIINNNNNLKIRIQGLNIGGCFSQNRIHHVSQIMATIVFI